MSVVSLQMYDSKAMQEANDLWWLVLKEELRDAGFDPPSHLHRSANLSEVWSSPLMLLGQTCGLPYVRYLRDKVQLVATPDYAVDGCSPGWYRSLVIVRRDDPRQSLLDFAQGSAAINSFDSYSGCIAFRHHLTNLFGMERFFAQVQITESHAASMQAVVGKRADIAAIDAVSWRLLSANTAVADALRVLTQTEPAPGLPIVTSNATKSKYDTSIQGTVDDVLFQVLSQSLQQLPSEVRSALGIRGMVRLSETDYDLIAQRDSATGSLSRLSVASSRSSL